MECLMGIYKLVKTKNCIFEIIIFSKEQAKAHGHKLSITGYRTGEVGRDGDASLLHQTTWSSLVKGRAGIFLLL